MSQQDFLMPAEGIQIDSCFSFKPIDHLGASGSDSFGGEPRSPTAIFREAAEGLHHHYNNADNHNNDPMSISPLQLALANPIHEQRGSGHVDLDVNADQAGALQASGPGTRVISPYLFLHATEGELEERQQLSGEAITWSGMPTEEIADESTTEEHHQFQHESNPRIDYSSFFQSVANVKVNFNASAAGIMECDDFSISSHEVESIDDDLWCFEKISGDPAAFWEEGIDQRVSGPKRVRIPSQDSSSTDCPVRPIVSVGKVPRRR
jgi:hypothetical protein